MAKPFFLIQTCIKITLTVHIKKKNPKAKQAPNVPPCNKTHFTATVLRCRGRRGQTLLSLLCTYFLAFTAN